MKYATADSFELQQTLDRLRRENMTYQDELATLLDQNRKMAAKLDLVERFFSQVEELKVYFDEC